MDKDRTPPILAQHKNQRASFQGSLGKSASDHPRRCRVFFTSQHQFHKLSEVASCLLFLVGLSMSAGSGLDCNFRQDTRSTE